MAQLTYNSINKFRYYGQEANCSEETEPEENLRDSLIKQIVASHLRTNVNIDDIFSNKSKFITSLKQEDVSNLSKGLMTNEAYKRVCEEADIKEILSSCDLQEADINFLLNKNSKPGKETNEAYEQRLSNIQEKLKEKQILLEDDSFERFSGALKLNRHEFEEEQRKVVSSEAKKFTNCLVHLEPHSDPTVSVDHPINKLSDLAKQLFQESPKRKGAHRENSVKKLKGPSLPSYRFFSEKPTTLWDMKEKPLYQVTSASKNEQMENGSDEIKLVSQRKELEKEPDYSKPFIWNLEPSKLVPISSIKENQLPVDEIKMNPKFKSYDPGTPSSVLYVKNLLPQTSPITLASLFGHFQKENEPKKIEYRILKGKMKGQAFIYFSSLEVASRALSLCNGYVVNNKPMVIEFGKKA